MSRSDGHIPNPLIAKVIAASIAALLFGVVLAAETSKASTQEASEQIRELQAKQLRLLLQVREVVPCRHATSADRCSKVRPATG